MASGKQVRLILPPTPRSLLVVISCDVTADRIISGFGKAGLFCKTSAWFSAGGTFSTLAFASASKETLHYRHNTGGV